MGGSTQQKQTTATTTTPWDKFNPEINGLKGLLGTQMGMAGLSPTETNAISNLEANASAGNPFSGAITGVANQFLSGGPDRTGMVQGAVDEARAGLMPFATGSTNPYENQDFTRMLDDTTRRTMDAVKSSYGNAGISAASYGDFGKTAGQGITSAIAPLAYQASNDLANRKLGAISSLYGTTSGGAGLLSGLDQTAMGNKAAGVDLSSAALAARDSPWTQLLSLEGQQFGIPMQRTSQIASTLLPYAGLGSSTSGTSTSSTQVPLLQQIAGGLLGGAGLLGQTGGFGSNGWLYGSGKGATGLFNRSA